jgi:aspartyl-tRNA(Asn)/glutamyl-tRNA(Gln) amidotransferase subunit C
MSLTIEEVKRIAHLARLQITDEEVVRYREQLSSILDHVAKLQSLDTREVEPMSSVVRDRSPLRQDEPGDSLPVDTLMGNAPRSEDAHFSVPPILDSE